MASQAPPPQPQPQPQPLVVLLQSLLVQDDASVAPTQRSAALAARLSSTLATLSAVPTLHTVALETLTSAYLLLLAQHDQAMMNPSLLAAARGACEQLSSLLHHCPAVWSPRILMWCAGLYGQVAGGRGTSLSLEESLKIWLTHPLLSTVSTLMEQSVELLVGAGESKQCLEALLAVCAQHAPHLNWLLAHAISLHPSSLLPPLLSLPASSSTSSMLAAVLECLSSVSRSGLQRCVAAHLAGALPSPGWRGAVSSLLALAAACPGLARAVGARCLSVVTPATIQEIVDRQMGAMGGPRDGHAGDEEEEDEGEVLSDEEGGAGEEGGVGQGDAGREAEKGGPAQSDEELSWRLAEVVCVLEGPAAATAIDYLMETHKQMCRRQQTQEEAMEEGEIVRESPAVGVRLGCERAMGRVLARLHTAAQLHTLPHPPPHPPQRSAKVAGLEFALHLQSSLLPWSRQLLATDLSATSSGAGWLCELIAGVCVCSSELVAAEALAALLLRCTHRDKLPLVLSVYWAVQARHGGARLASSILHTALAVLSRRDGREGEGEEEGEEEGMKTFCRNLHWLLGAPSGPHSAAISSHFLCAVSGHALEVLALLPLPGGVAVLSLLPSLPPPEWGQAKMILTAHRLLTAFFSLLYYNCTQLATVGCIDVEVECSLSQLRKLVVRWVCAGEGTELAVYTTVLTKVLSDEMSGRLGGQAAPTPPTQQYPAPSSLLSSSLPPSHPHPPHVTVCHSQHRGSLQIRPARPTRVEAGRPARLSGTAASAQSRASAALDYSSRQLLLLLTAAVGDRVAPLASVLLGLVAPHAPQNPAHWPHQDNQSLEWDLGIVRQFQCHPLLWPLLTLIAAGGGLCECASLVSSHLSVLRRHWAHCRTPMAAQSAKELQSSLLLLCCLAEARWLPAPLLLCAELLPLVSTAEAHHLLAAVEAFLKENYSTSIGTSAISKLKDTGYCRAVKLVLLSNIDKCGALYSRYLKYSTQ